MQAAPARRAYQTLDGLRAAGAFVIVMRHVPFLFGPVKVPESFLAVDLFYLISGFVVAHAYGERLRAGASVTNFMKTRLIRLYPLYLVGLAIGLVAAILTILTDPTTWWTPAKLAITVSTGLFMIPRFPGLEVNGSTLDGPTWTLLPELIANLVYALAIRFMTTAVLLAIVVVCGSGVILAELHYGTLDVGYSLTDQWGALVRVGFSFFMGVLVFKLFGDKERKSEWVAWVCVALVTVALASTLSEGLIPYGELGLVLIGFPALLVVATRYEPNALTGRVFSFIGLMSYAIYLLHQPLGTLARLAIQHGVRVPTDARGLIVGALFLAFLVGLSWALDVFYDAPLRRVLRAWIMGERPKPAAAPGASPSASPPPF